MGGGVVSSQRGLVRVKKGRGRGGEGEEGNGRGGKLCFAPSYREAPPQVSAEFPPMSFTEFLPWPKTYILCLLCLESEPDEFHM